MFAAFIAAIAVSGTPMPPRAQAIATVQVQIISGASLNLHSSTAAIAGAKVNTKTALIEFY